jgi:O-methyltransferase domain/Dimerisation domain
MAIQNLTYARSMIHLLMSYIPTRVIYVAAKLGLVDHIGTNGATAQDIANKLNVHPDALYRVMRMLAGLGVLRQDNNDRFLVTPYGETLRKDSPQSVTGYAIYSHEFAYSAFEKIMDSVRTGKPVIENHFEYLRAHPGLEEIFHAGMSSRGRIETAAILDAYDFSTCGTIVDVGGGNGAFLSGILTSCEGVSGVLFDQKSAIDSARAGRGGPLPRCEFIPGNFFDSVPLGGETYVLKRVLPDWTDEEVIKILENCRRAMASQAPLLIIDALIGPPNQQNPGHLYDMTFLVLLGGRVRTHGEYSALLDQTGFRLQRVLPTESDVSILEALAT